MNVTPIADSQRSSATENGLATTSQPKSSKPTQRSKSSKRRWRQPQTVMDFVSQVNAVANKVLNGEIDLDSARTYSGLARVIAQGLNSEVSRSRFLKTAPELCMSGLSDLEEDEEG